MDFNLILCGFCSTVAFRFGYNLWHIHNQGIDISFKMKYQYKLGGTYVQKRRKYKLALTLVWTAVIVCSLVAAITAALMIKGL